MPTGAASRRERGCASEFRPSGRASWSGRAEGDGEVSDEMGSNAYVEIHLLDGNAGLLAVVGGTVAEAAEDAGECLADAIRDGAESVTVKVLLGGSRAG